MHLYRQHIVNHKLIILNEMYRISTVLLFVVLTFNLLNGQNNIKNPIIPGFNPDPCIVGVGEDYYIVTSSFEWFPGIPIYHSKDLQNWTQLGHVLTTTEQLSMGSIVDSEGIYAPSITYHNGIYYV